MVQLEDIPFRVCSSIVQVIFGAVEKVLFNHKAHKEGTSFDKLRVRYKVKTLYFKPLCNTFVTFVVNGFRLFQHPHVHPDF